MGWKHFLPLAIAWVACAQTLEDILTAQSATLGSLNAWLASEQVVFDILNSAQGVTLLAPSNNALSQLANTPLYGQLASDPNLLVAFLSYHVLDGVYPIANLSAAPVSAVQTYMNMRAYANVSGGQVIDSVPQNGALTFVTGNGAQSNVQQYDLNYMGGTVHVIDSVLSIPGTVSDTLISGGLTAAAGALRRADIEAPLNQASDVTVFAPTNDAFNAIGSSVNGMTLEQLTNMLNYHVIPGKVLYSQLMATPGSEATQEGGNLNFRTEGGELFVNGAKVVAADVLVGNGVVHVVDGVLNPDNSTATPDPSAATQAPAFNGASSTSGGVPFTSAVVTTTTSTAAAGPSSSPSNAPGMADDASAGPAAVGFAMLFGGAAMWANL